MLNRDSLRTLSIDQLFSVIENLADRLSRHESSITQLEESSQKNAVRLSRHESRITQLEESSQENQASLDYLLADYRYKDRNQDLEAKLSFYCPEEGD
jgi:septal ring factor EnvC (AmiA/AmiB activator)